MGERDNRDVLLSVNPQYANLLVDGVKTVELRRKFPEELSSGTKCLIYSTSPVQRVIGECKVDKIERLSISELWTSTSQRALVSWKDFSCYFDGVSEGYAIHFYGYTRYKNAKALDSVLGRNSRAPQSYRYVPRNQISSEV